jgi:hypothetical protein
MEVSVTVKCASREELNSILTSIYGGAGKNEAKQEPLSGEAEAPKEEKKKSNKGKKTESKKKEEPAEPELTVKDIRKAFSRLLDALSEDDGPTVGRKLLKKYNAKQVPDIDKDYYGNVMEDIETLIAEAENSEEDSDDLGIGDVDDE